MLDILDSALDTIINKYSIFMYVTDSETLFKWVLYHCFMLRKKTLLGFARFGLFSFLYIKILFLL